MRYNWKRGKGIISTEEFGDVGMSWEEIMPFVEKKRRVMKIRSGDELVFDISDNISWKFKEYAATRHLECRV